MKLQPGWLVLSLLEVMGGKNTEVGKCQETQNWKRKVSKATLKGS